MRKLIYLFFAMAMTMGVSTTHADIFILSGDMDPDQATTNPTNTGDGFGAILGTYDDDTNELEYTITWQDLTSSVTNMHFHVGAPGSPGGVDLAVSGPWSSPQTGNATLNATQETNLLSGLWYLNVHTSNFGGGEIRGQVIVTAVPEPATAAFCTLAFVTLGLRRRRIATR